jgi:hypothetical protein
MRCCRALILIEFLVRRLLPDAIRDVFRSLNGIRTSAATSTKAATMAGPKARLAGHGGDSNG